MYDLLIKNGTVVDGTGAPRFKADVLVKDGKIEKVALNIQEEAKETVDAGGLIVAPGFIDWHSHSDLTVLMDWDAANILKQGITLEITGHCGVSTAPYTNPILTNVEIRMPEETRKEMTEKGGSFKAFKEILSRQQLPTNMSFFVGHGALRSRVMAYENREPTKAEMDEMKALLKEAMDEGAMGLSSGLIYPPGNYSKSDELVELAKVTHSYGGIYTTHMRSEGDGVVESVKETIDLAREAKVPAVVSHHKISGKQNEGRSKDTLRMIKEANEEGLKISLDQYPYNGGSTSLMSVFPPSYASDGLDALVERLKGEALREELRQRLSGADPTFENMVYYCGFDGILISSESCPEVNGMSIQQLAEKEGKEPFTCMFDLMVRTKGDVKAIYLMINEWDMENILKYPYTMAGIDGSHQPEVKASVHPRTVATYPRLIGTFCRDKGFFELEEIIHRFTGLAADTAGFSDKGYIKAGIDADLVLFDFDKISGNASYGHADIPNEGIHYVFVNGVLALKDGKVTGKRGGKAIYLR